MALVVKDRVRETTTTTGTGAVTLAGAVAGFQSFSVIGNGNTTYYTITDNAANWEVGIGTYTSAGTSLSRDTILESSNAGAAVNFGAGTKDVFVTYPAEKSISDGYGLLPVANGGTGAATLTGVVKGNGTSAFTTSNVNLTSEVTGTLPVGNGGTGTATAFTAGSVVFAGASGVYSQDNANLFWDDTNNRLGIGDATPSCPLDVAGTTNSLVQQWQGAGGTFNLQVNAVGSAVNTNCYRLELNFTSGPGSNGYIDFERGDAAFNGELAFGTNGSERFRLDRNGNVAVGTAAIATTATNGFLYIPTCAGTPTGTPTTKTGLAPMVVDSTNNKLYVYISGAWRVMN